MSLDHRARCDERENVLEHVLRLVRESTGSPLDKSHLSSDISPSRERTASVVGDGGVRRRDEYFELSGSLDGRRTGQEEGTITVGEDSSKSGRDCADGEGERTSGQKERKDWLKRRAKMGAHLSTEETAMTPVPRAGDEV